MSKYRADSVEFKTWKTSIGMVYHSTLSKAFERCAKSNKKSEPIMDIINGLKSESEEWVSNASAITASSYEFIMMFFCEETEEHNVVHECMHATSMAMMNKGLQLTPESEEAYCYFIERLSKKAMKFIREAKRK